MANPSERDDRQPGRHSASVALQAFRRYVTDFVNRHDFSVLPDIMDEDYTLATSGELISGRDGAYREAVAKQLSQFPGLQFTIHELAVCRNRVCVRFTEHGASLKHDSATASWPGIAIYETRGGLLVRCSIEQDYYSRRRQLEQRSPVAVDPPAIAPWDEIDQPPDPSAEAVVRDWLRGNDWKHDTAIRVDDSHATGRIDSIIEAGGVEVLTLASGGGRVGFHARETGELGSEFAATLGVAPGERVSMSFSAFVRVSDSKVVDGHVIRDRWGVFRRYSRAQRRL